MSACLSKPQLKPNRFGNPVVKMGLQMPLYEYKCHSCGKTFEVIQKFADEPLKTHAECGGEVERLLSAPAFHLKGTGWYATDYGKGNGGRAGELKSSEKPGGGE